MADPATIATEALAPEDYARALAWAESVVAKPSYFPIHCFNPARALLEAEQRVAKQREEIERLKEERDFARTVYTEHQKRPAGLAESQSATLSQRVDELEGENARLRLGLDDWCGRAHAMSLSLDKEECKVSYLQERCEGLEAALRDLERGASGVAKLGATPGAQWVYLTGALLQARATLSNNTGEKNG